MDFSGRTTCPEHKNDSKWKNSLWKGKECLVTERVLNVQFTNCPVEVEDEIRKIWKREGLSNDTAYYRTSLADLDELDDWDGEDDPIVPVNWSLIKDFLVSKGVTDPEETILIHWWW